MISLAGMVIMAVGIVKDDFLRFGEVLRKDDFSWFGYSVATNGDLGALFF